MGSKTLFTNKAVTGLSPVVDYSDSMEPHKSNKVVQAYGKVSTSTGSAAIDIEASFDQGVWTVLGTINLTLGTTNTSNKFATTEAWPFLRLNLKTLTGTGPTINAFLGD